MYAAREGARPARRIIEQKRKWRTKGKHEIEEGTKGPARGEILREGGGLIGSFEMCVVLPVYVARVTCKFLWFLLEKKIMAKKRNVLISPSPRALV